MQRPHSILTDPIPQLTLRIAIPSSVGMFFNTLFNFVDTYCAGFLGTGALAALSVSFPLFFMMIAMGSGLAQGATVVISRALGARDVDMARRLFAQSLLTALAAGMLLTGIGWFVAPRVFPLLGANGDWLVQTLDYVNALFSGSIFFVLSMALNAGLSAQGETRTYRNILLAGFLANCALNPLLMWGFAWMPAMGVKGIAIATVIVQISSCVWLWHRVRQTEVAADLRISDFMPHKRLLREIASQSVPAMLNMATIALGIMVMVWHVKQFGQQAVAALGIATRIEQVVLMPAIGLATAMLSIVGQNHGAGQFQRVAEAWTTNIRNGAGMMIAGGAVLWMCGRYLMGLFTDDAEVIRRGSEYLAASSLTLAAYPILFVTVFMMQALKRPGYGLWMGIYRQVVAPIVVYPSFATSLGWGLSGIWWGMTLVTWSAGLFALWWGWRACLELTQKQPSRDAEIAF